MSILRQHHFRNSGITVIDLPGDPNADPPGQGGKMIVITDPETGDSYHYASNNDVMRTVGQQLMGIGNVQLANGSDMAKVLKHAKDSKRG